MKKSWIALMILGTSLLSVFFLIFIIVKHWDKIADCVESGREKAEKVINTVTRAKDDSEPGDYLEI